MTPGSGITEKPAEKNNRAGRARWLMVALWMILIFTLSSISLPPASQTLFRFQDKLVHLFEFGVLALLMVRAVRPDAPGRKARYWLCICAVLLYGVLDEFHQHFVPGRSVELSDMAADGLGGVLFAWAWLAWHGERLFKIT